MKPSFNKEEDDGKNGTVHPSPSFDFTLFLLLYYSES